MTLRVLTLSSSLVLVTALGVACSADSVPDGGGSPDSGTIDGGTIDGDSGTIDGDGGGTIDGGDAGDGANGDCGSTLTATVRDFKGIAEPGHVDFEFSNKPNPSGGFITEEDGTSFKGWNDSGCGLVLPTLGADRKPVFNDVPVMINGEPVIGIGAQRRLVTGPGCYPNTGDCFVGTCTAWTDFKPPATTIQSAVSFSDWYNTKPEINQEFDVELALPETSPGSGVRVYDSNAFFPIDGQGFGNTPGQLHNFHFTTEIHVKFVYEAGQNFTFRGDDDLWIFVNGKLALDVGGAHQALQGSIDFDAQAAALEITPGREYSMDIFHAERQTTESNFRIETNISCFVPAPITK